MTNTAMSLVENSHKIQYILGLIQITVDDLLQEPIVN